MIEIEFIPVGEETNTGDAILCHFTEPVTEIDRVVLVDGGFTDTSDAIVSHVRTYYGRESIDLAVCTHPDDDHINGLTGVVDDLAVANLLIHRPRDHGFSGDEVRSQKIEDLIATATSRGTNVITRAFAGQTFYNGAIAIGGPTKDFYIKQLQAQTGTESVSSLLSKLLGGAAHSINNALKPRGDDPGEGVFTDNGGTTARNNSSIVLDIQVDGYRALLTGDAGVPALNAAVDNLQSIGRTSQYPDFFDVPHHGSRHNLDTATCDRLLGPVVGDTQVRTAFVSVGKKADDFPRPEVANALKRRGCRVSPTRGQTIRWSRNAGDRPGWVSLVPLGWLDI